MWSQFFLEHIRFTVELIAVLICFSSAWLHLDAWYVRRQNRELTKPVAFIFLAIGFLAEALYVDSRLFTSVVMFQESVQQIATYSRLVGYILLIIAQLTEPLMPHPFRSNKSHWVVMIPIVAFPIQIVLPVAASITGFLYLRRATRGLEHHLKPVALSLYIVSFYELLKSFSILSSTKSVELYTLIAPFGFVWKAELIFLVISMLVLGKWVLSYQLKQFESQLFIYISLLILGICVVTTITFSGMMMNKVITQLSDQLKTQNNLLHITIAQQKEYLSKSVIQLSKASSLVTALDAKNTDDLTAIARDAMIAGTYAGVRILDSNARVVADADTDESIGDSLSSDIQVAEALAGATSVRFNKFQSGMVPGIEIRAISPIYSSGKVIGAIMLRSALDQGYIEMISGQVASSLGIVSGSTLSATNLTSQDGQVTLVGLQIPDELKKNYMNTKNVQYGSYTFGTKKYLVAFAPFLDISDVPIGLSLVAYPEDSVMAVAAESVAATFQLACVLLIFALIPSYLIARSMTKQIT